MHTVGGKNTKSGEGENTFRGGTPAEAGNGAWGAFDTDIYLTYDYKKVWLEYVEKREEAKDERN